MTSEMLKIMQIYKKYKFWGFHCFFAIFWFFLKIYQNMGQKLDSNNYHPLVSLLVRSCSLNFKILKLKPNLTGFVF